MNELRLRVYGQPVPQGSKKGFVNPKTNRAIIVDSNAKPLRDWRGQVSQAAGDYAEQTGLDPIDEPAWIKVTFIMARPKSAPSWKRWAHTRPDVDKLLRAVFDAITGTIVVDDARFVLVATEKQLADHGNPPGCVIEVGVLGSVERDGCGATASILIDWADG